MATINKQVATYLPPDLEDKIADYCVKHGINRKDKDGKITPSLGTAIVEILKVFFGQDNVPSPNQSQPIDLSGIESDLKEYINSNVSSGRSSLN